MASFLALTGFMGSGKTSVGRGVAARLGWDFIDLDEELCRATALSIPEFFAARGEAAFRQKECEVLEHVLNKAPEAHGLVVALGGGTLESPRAADLLARSGGLVLLDVEPGTAWTRVDRTDRPLAVDSEQFSALLSHRRPSYEEAADWVVRVGSRSVDELVEEIADLVEVAGDHLQTLWGRRLASTARTSLIVGGKHALSVLSRQAAAARAAGSRLFVVTDGNVMVGWGERVLTALGEASSDTFLVMEPGEASKNVASLERCWDWLAGRGVRRDDIVVALGGGVVGDLAGFAAATYQRGIALWQIPTSLLAQVDSSVGGKTAVNLRTGKNLVGVFYQPDLVVADPATLSTLPDEEYVAGLGEVVKYALLMSPPFLSWLEGEVEAVMGRDPRVVGRLVKACVIYKARVVDEDEREGARRAVLNLGHTTAHALEVVRGYGALSHGSAVALGLLVALAASERILGLDESVRERTRALLAQFGLPTTLPLLCAEDLLAAMAHDKKVKAGSSGFVGLKDLGTPVWGLDVSNGALIQALEVIRE